jgi:hypothetical protein
MNVRIGTWSIFGFERSAVIDESCFMVFLPFYLTAAEGDLSETTRLDTL